MVPDYISSVKTSRGINNSLLFCYSELSGKQKSCSCNQKKSGEKKNLEKEEVEEEGNLL